MRLYYLLHCSYFGFSHSECTNCFRKLEKEKKKKKKLRENTGSVIKKNKENTGWDIRRKYRSYEQGTEPRVECHYRTITSCCCELSKWLSSAIITSGKKQMTARAYATWRGEERQSQGPRYNISQYAWECVGAHMYTPSWPSFLFLSLLSLSLSLKHIHTRIFTHSLIFGVSLRTTDRAENIGTPYVFPETRGFIEAIMPTIRAKTKTSL